MNAIADYGDDDDAELVVDAINDECAVESNASPSLIPYIAKVADSSTGTVVSSESNEQQASSIFLLSASNSNSLDTSQTNSECVLCEICNTSVKKYKCPRCSTFTCCLECVKEHKLQTGCNGLRDRTAFVAAKEFEGQHLRSDYHFLEDVLQTRGTAARMFHKHVGGNKGTKQPKPFRKRGQGSGKTINQFASSSQSLDSYSKGVRNLFHAAKERGTKLMFLPNGMSKRSANTTIYDSRIKTIRWKVNVAFILNNSIATADLNAFDSFVPSSSNLSIYHSEAVDRSLNPNSQRLSFQAYSVNSTVVGVCLNDVNENVNVDSMLNSVLDGLQSGSALKHMLKDMAAVRHSRHVLMRVFPSPANNPLFCEIMPSMAIKDVLNGQTILEYPTVYVCSPSALSQFRLLVSGVNDVQIEAPRDRSRGKRKLPLDNSGPEHCLKKTSVNSTKDLIGEDEHDSQQESLADDGQGGEDISDSSSEELEDDPDDGYDEFMQEFVNLQNVDIEDLKSLIAAEEK